VKFPDVDVSRKTRELLNVVKLAVVVVLIFLRSVSMFLTIYVFYFPGYEYFNFCEGINNGGLC